MSDYMRWELGWGYGKNVRAGEDVRILPVPEGEWPADLPRHDYWLFDSRDLWAMSYDEDGRFLHADLIDDPGEIVRAGYWRDAALHQSIGYDEYMRRHPALLDAP